MFASARGRIIYISLRGVWDRRAVGWIPSNWTIPFLRSYPSKTFFLRRVSDNVNEKSRLATHRRVSSRWMRLHRFQRLKVSISTNRTHCAALSVDFLGWVLRFESIIRYSAGKKRGVCSTTSACITEHDRTHASDNAPSVYLVPFLRLSSALIVLNPLGLHRILNFPEHGNNITQRNVAFINWHIRL